MYAGTGWGWDRRVHVWPIINHSVNDSGGHRSVSIGFAVVVHVVGEDYDDDGDDLQSLVQHGRLVHVLVSYHRRLQTDSE